MAYIPAVGRPHPYIPPGHGLDGGVVGHDDTMWKFHLLSPRLTPKLVKSVANGELRLALLPITTRGWVWLLEVYPGTVVEAPFTPALQHPEDRQIPDPSPEGTGSLMIELIDEWAILRATRLVEIPSAMYQTATTLYAKAMRGARKPSLDKWDADLRRYETKYPDPGKTLVDAAVVHVVAEAQNS